MRLAAPFTFIAGSLALTAPALAQAPAGQPETAPTAVSTEQPKVDPAAGQATDTPPPQAEPVAEAPATTETTSSGSTEPAPLGPESTMASSLAPAPSAPERGWPRVGGHLALAIPIVTFADPVTAIGADFTKIGLAPGVTVKLNERWAIDFEFVAYSNFWGGGNISSLVVDPGVIYSFDFASVGLRAAIHVGQTQNFGVIPIILKAFPLGDGTVKAFVELDLPLFFDETGAALTIQPQAGIAF